MKQHLLRLENGLKICLIPNPEVDSIAVYLKGLAGSNCETLHNVGTAHVLEHLVLKGTQNYKTEASLLKLITNEGGKFIGVTSRNDVLFGTHVLKDGLENSLIFLSEIFYRPLLQAKDLAEVKNLAKVEINRCFDNGEKLVSRLAYEALFPNTRLAKFNIGNIDNVEKINLGIIKRFYKKFYTNNRFILVISGNFNVNNTKKLINKHFSSLTRNSSEDRIFKVTKKAVTKIHNYNFSQNYIRYDFEGFKTSDDRKYSALVLAKYLNSIVKALTQKNGIAYKTVVSSETARWYGIFSFYGSCSGNKSQELISIFKTTAKMGIDKSLFENSKKSIIADILFALEKTSMRAEYYSDILLHGNEKQNHKTEIQKIKKVSLKDVEVLAEKIFSQKPKLTIIRVKP